MYNYSVIFSYNTVKNGVLHYSLIGEFSLHPVTCITLRERWYTLSIHWAYIITPREFSVIKKCKPTMKTVTSKTRSLVTRPLFSAGIIACSISAPQKRVWDKSPHVLVLRPTRFVGRWLVSPDVMRLLICTV